MLQKRPSRKDEEISQQGRKFLCCAQNIFFALSIFLLVLHKCCLHVISYSSQRILISKIFESESKNKAAMKAGRVRWSDMLMDEITARRKMQMQRFARPIYPKKQSQLPRNLHHNYPFDRHRMTFESSTQKRFFAYTFHLNRDPDRKKYEP